MFCIYTSLHLQTRQGSARNCGIVTVFWCVLCILGEHGLLCVRYWHKFPPSKTTKLCAKLWNCFFWCLIYSWSTLVVVLCSVRTQMSTFKNGNTVRDAIEAWVFLHLNMFISGEHWFLPCVFFLKNDKAVQPAVEQWLLFRFFLSMNIDFFSVFCFWIHKWKSRERSCYIVSSFLFGMYVSIEQLFCFPSAFKHPSQHFFWFFYF